ncbi:MAG: DUF433 domain-containing protein [Cyanobacteria bacterium P01_D01_bin.105]
MSDATDSQSTIVRTERGLSISGTRITIYDVMDYVTAGYPAHFIRGLFNLSEAQIGTALQYIQDNRALVEAEYQQVLKESEERQQYYEQLNRDLHIKSRQAPPQPGMEAAWRKLQARRSQRQHSV